jgi:hypothetical protein
MQRVSWSRLRWSTGPNVLIVPTCCSFPRVRCENRRVELDWWDQPRRAPADYALELAGMEPFPRDERMFIATVHEIEELAEFLDVASELAHALVLALSVQPEALRRDFAERFYARRTPRGGASTQFAAAATAALGVLELTDIRSERVVDLLTGAAQGDDVSVTPEPAVAEVRKAVVRARLDLGLEDQLATRSAATTAVVEVLDPSGGVVSLQEVLLRATWAALRSWAHERVVELLVAVDVARTPE